MGAEVPLLIIIKLEGGCLGLTKIRDRISKLEVVCLEEGEDLGKIIINNSKEG